MFVYAPFVLKMMSTARLIFPGRALWYAYLALACTASVCLPVLISLCLGVRWLSIAVSILISSLLPGFMAEFSLLSGNVAALLYAMVLLALLFALRSERWSPFYVAVVVSALIKPPMLAFLLFPFLRGYILPSVVSTLAVALGFLAQRLFMPALYHRFSQAVYTQLVFTGDMGFGIFAKLPGPLRTGAPVFFAAGVAAVLWYLRPGRWSTASRVWLPAVLLTCILASPRLLGYDAQIAMLPALCLLLEIPSTWSDKQKTIASTLISLALLVVCKKTSIYIASQFLLLALCAGLYRAFSDRLPEGQRA
jgi:hypothetical protein